MKFAPTVTETRFDNEKREIPGFDILRNILRDQGGGERLQMSWKCGPKERTSGNVGGGSFGGLGTIRRNPSAIGGFVGGGNGGKQEGCLGRSGGVEIVDDGGGFTGGATFKWNERMVMGNVAGDSHDLVASRPRRRLATIKTATLPEVFQHSGKLSRRDRTLDITLMSKILWINFLYDPHTSG